MRSRNADLFSIAPIAMTMLGINLVLYVYCGIASNNFGRINSEVLTNLGMSIRERVWEGEWNRLIMPMFLHGGLMHILFNAIYLYQMGPVGEVQFGSYNFGTLYLLSGVGGIAFSQIFGGYPSIGASTSLFGIIGALLSVTIVRAPILKNAWRSSEVRREAMWAALMFLFGLSGMMGPVDNWGHLGGFVFGLILGAFFELWRRSARIGLPLLMAVVLFIGGTVCAARWTIFSPYYHLHMGALAGDSGDSAREEREFAAAQRWSNIWHDKPIIEYLIYHYRLKHWTAERASLEGYRYLPYSIAADLSGDDGA
jgi:rhomboid protease GluP